MGIPAPNEMGELPLGDYEVSLDEIERRSGHANERRRKLMRGLRKGAANLANAGVRKIWVDGNFVTATGKPNDIDGVWETHDQI